MHIKFSFLFRRLMNYHSLRIIKLVFTVLTSIFWCLSFSNRNMNTFTSWTHFNKILGHLKKYIMGSFNKFIFFFNQNLISDFGIVIILIRKSIWEAISNCNLFMKICYF